MRKWACRDFVAAHVAPHVSVLSAGEAHVAHPTQGLLDALTIYQRKQRFAGLAVAIVGDIRHSRVARSAWQVLHTLGVSDLRIVAPAALLPESHEFAGAPRATAILRGAGRLRRHHDAAHPEGAHGAGRPAAGGRSTSGSGGSRRSGLKLARADAIVMPPATDEPGVEIASEVADGRALGDPRPGA